MPTYDYVCKACAHAFEEFQSMTAPHLKKCPKCGKAKLERLIGTGAALLFKGSGFYQTDYRTDSYRKGADAEKPSTEASKSDAKVDAKAESKSTDSKAEAKPDSKPDSKPEAKVRPDSAKASSENAPAGASPKPPGSKSSSKKK